MDHSGLDLVLFNDADTLAYIDPPEYKPTWSVQPSSAETIAHRIHSKRLLDTGSPVLRKVFEPRTQTRNAKRRGAPPDGIKYLIDLTPPSVDEDAVLFLTELSCPLGIRTWVNSQGRWDLPLACVGGEDEPKLLEGNSKSSDLPEYSASRHCTGIVHILQVLEGITPRIDTPCKLWTFFALAKLYEIATHPQVSFQILSWIYESSNKRIIELHPEVVYRIAHGIQCSYLCRDSFSVMVGEEALQLFHNSIEGIGPSRQQTTLHGRHREMLDDEELQRLEYASKSFMEYLVVKFLDLVAVEMPWLSRLSAFQNILFYTPESGDERVIVSELISCLKDYVRGCIVTTLDHPSLTWLASRSEVENSAIYPMRNFLNVYASMHCIERIMSRTFWTNLGNRDFEAEDCTSLPPTYWNTSIAHLGHQLEGFREHKDAIIRPVEKKELYRKINAFNTLVKDSISEIQSHSSPNTSYIKTFKGRRAITPKNTDIFSDYSQPLPTMNSPVFQEFEPWAFFVELKSFISTYANMVKRPSRDAMAYEVTDTLTCLTDEEFKYLPLWAEGNDDGSGGVFMDQNIPFMESGGFSAPGPSIHTGSTASSCSSFSVVSTSDINSTTQRASHRATEGYDSEIVSINSETISKGADMERMNHTSTSVKTESNDGRFSPNVDMAADIDNLSFDAYSDSDDTVLVGHHEDLDDFEQLDLNDDSPSSSSPSRG